MGNVTNPYPLPLEVEWLGANNDKRRSGMYATVLSARLKRRGGREISLDERLQGSRALVLVAASMEEPCLFSILPPRPEGSILPHGGCESRVSPSTGCYLWRGGRLPASHASTHFYRYPCCVHPQVLMAQNAAGLYSTGSGRS